MSVRPVSRRLPRGQALVLFSLGTLLVVLMVVLTLSFSMKVRERIEVQTVADAAAYTNAVATARTFNNIAVLNRAQIAHAVAQAGAQSLISWTTMYRAYLNATRASFKDAEWPYQLNQALGCPCAWSNAGCARACQCGRRGMSDLRSLQNAFRNEDRLIEPAFQAADARAGLQLLLHQTAQLGIYAAQQVTYRDLMNSLGDQDFASDIADSVAPGAARNEWLTPGGLTLNRSELRGGAFCTDSGAMCELPLSVAHAVNAAMGSRGYRFVTHRNYMDYMPHMVRLLLAMARTGRTSFIIITGEGTAYFKKPALLGSMGAVMNMLPPYGDAVTAQDEGSARGFYLHIANGGAPPCPPIMPGSTQEAKAEVVGAGFGFKHTWTGGRDRMPFVHFLVPCTAGISSCPGIWPAFIDYNAVGVADEDDNFAQPKNFALVQRDMSRREVADPWNFFTRFRFEPGSQGTEFNSRGLELADGTPNSVQTALATGIAYYHRGTSLGINHWAEPPNLLNPYWRATLVAPDIDQTGLRDASNTLRNASSVAWETYEALLAAGFKGIQ